MEDNLDYIYGDDTVDIYNSVYNKDFDEVGWEPELVDDGDEESAELYGY